MSLINRMLAYDWRYTLADSDLPKVQGAAAMAGIPVGYPLLSDRLTDFSMALSPDWKVRRLKLRWFFKEALRGFLPDATLTKKKKGFGLPFGVWAASDPALKKLAAESLYSARKRVIPSQTSVSNTMSACGRPLLGRARQILSTTTAATICPRIAALSVVSTHTCGTAQVVETM